MALSFEQALQLYKQDEINKLADSDEGIRFLLLKSLDRPEYENRLAQISGLQLSTFHGRTRFRTLFNSSITTDQARRFIADIYLVERGTRRQAEANLVAELYKMRSFDWGGLHQNSLETTIIDNYVKKNHKIREAE